MTDDEKAIHELVQAWMQASEAGDTQTVLSLMTDDVVFMVPGREPFGREHFEAASAAMAGMRIRGRSDIVELQVLGAVAFSRNRIEMEMTPAGGQTVRRSGYTLTLYRKEGDGRWRLMRDANLLTANG